MSVLTVGTPEQIAEAEAGQAAGFAAGEAALTAAMVSGSNTGEAGGGEKELSDFVLLVTKQGLRISHSETLF